MGVLKTSIYGGLIVAAAAGVYAYDTTDKQAHGMNIADSRAFCHRLFALEDGNQSEEETEEQDSWYFQDVVKRRVTQRKGIKFALEQTDKDSSKIEIICQRDFRTHQSVFEPDVLRPVGFDCSREMSLDNCNEYNAGCTLIRVQKTPSELAPIPRNSTIYLDENGVDGLMEIAKIRGSISALWGYDHDERRELQADYRNVIEAGWKELMSGKAKTFNPDKIRPKSKRDGAKSKD